MAETDAPRTRHRLHVDEQGDEGVNKLLILALVALPIVILLVAFLDPITEAFDEAVDALFGGGESRGPDAGEGGDPGPQTPEEWQAKYMKDVEAANLDYHRLPWEERLQWGSFHAYMAAKHPDWTPGERSYEMVDPKGNRVQVVIHGSGFHPDTREQWFWYTVKSSGPDGQWGTDDDMAEVTDQRK